MQKKVWITLTMAVILILLAAVPASAWKNCVWLSMDLDLEARKMGFFHQDEVMTRIISEMTGTRHAFDISLSNSIINFDANSGLYGELGVNHRDRLNLLFGGGYKYFDPVSGFLLTVGTKYYLQDERLVNEVQFFYSLLPPLVLNLNYNDDLGSIFVGLGISFQ